MAILLTLHQALTAGEPSDGPEGREAHKGHRRSTLTEPEEGRQAGVLPGAESEVVEEPPPVRIKRQAGRRWASGYHLPKSKKAHENAVPEVVPEPPPCRSRLRELAEGEQCGNSGTNLPTSVMGMVHTATHTLRGLLGSDAAPSTRATLPQIFSTASKDSRFDGCQQAFKRNMGSRDHLVSGAQTSATLDVQLPLSGGDGTCRTQNDGACRADDALNPFNTETNHLLTASNVHNPPQHIASDLVVQSNCCDVQISADQASRVFVASDHIPHQQITPDLTKQSNYGDVQISNGTCHTPYQTSAQQTVQVSVLADHNPRKCVTPEVPRQPDYCDDQVSAEISHPPLQICGPQVDKNDSVIWLLIDFVIRFCKYLSQMITESVSISLPTY
ncbi:hypothetical protein PISMIDRAFT_17908 [Pisolithus microcarpus 441]|uniref:Unplaced genomic scaffold scaffold_304, whole genome shotgun sequence n=1 Tax=Pisolithus microcarpus 441 TaxID=765257 RepID=A0A0C9YTF4_9AGAM|nr:hypothetical protein BKA83DRAFT_17908 [Pisolithus microcarpus]KIK13552.1 hypothetical protein PISMIDRAFT_17908 [Pisolithus microcarpus 441]